MLCSGCKQPGGYEHLGGLQAVCLLRCVQPRRREGSMILRGPKPSLSTMHAIRCWFLNVQINRAVAWTNSAALEQVNSDFFKAFLETGAGLQQEFRLFGRALAAQHRIAVREAAEARDDLVVALRPAQQVGQRRRLLAQLFEQA